MNKLTEEELTVAEKKILINFTYGDDWPMNTPLKNMFILQFRPLKNSEQFLEILKKCSDQITDDVRDTLDSQGFNFGYEFDDFIWISEHKYEVLRAILAVLGEA